MVEGAEELEKASDRMVELLKEELDVNIIREGGKISFVVNRVLCISHMRYHEEDDSFEYFMHRLNEKTDVKDDISYFYRRKMFHNNSYMKNRARDILANIKIFKELSGG